MNSAQKKAWLNLIIIAVIVVISTIVVMVMRGHRILDVLGFLGFLWILTLPSLVGPPPFVPFRKKSGPVIIDERDLIIQERATLNAFRTFWYGFPIICMFLYWYIGQTGGLISVSALTIMAGGGGIMVSLVQSASLLIQYDRRDKGEKS